MSDVVITTTEQQGQGAAPPSPPQTYRLLRRVRRIGYLLLALQFTGFLIWSAVLYAHFSVTWDYSAVN